MKEIIAHFSSSLEELLRPLVIVSDAFSVFDKLEDGLMFRVISGRNVLSRLSEDSGILLRMRERLDKDGMIALIEAIPVLSSRLSDFAPDTIKSKLLEAEKSIYSSDNPLVSWGKKDLEDAVMRVFPDAVIEYAENTETRHLYPESLRGFYKGSYSISGLSEEEFVSAFSERDVKWSNTVALIRSGFVGMADKSSGSDWMDVNSKVRS